MTRNDRKSKEQWQKVGNVSVKAKMIALTLLRLLIHCAHMLTWFHRPLLLNEKKVMKVMALV